MIFTLLSHEWKSFWRARNAGTNLALQLVAGFGMLYLLAVAVTGGAYLAKILEQVFPQQDVVLVFCGFILYYFAFDIFIRFQLQELPVIFIYPYLILDIRRRQVVNFLNIRSLFSLFNVLPFVLLVPFIVLRVYPQHGLVVAMAFIMTVLFLTFFNHFLVMFIKRKTTVSGWWLAGFFAVVLLFIAADYFGFFSIRIISALLFTPLLKYPAGCAVPFALAVIAFFNNRSFLSRNLYLDESDKSRGQRTAADYTWLNRFGLTGELMGNELKLVLRNKRTLAALRSSFIFLFYGLFIYKTKRIEKDQLSIILFGSTFVTGTFIIQYARLIYSAQCGFFDGLMSSNISLRNYIKAKLAFLTGVSTVAFLLSLFYGFISWKIIPVELAGFFFNMGITAMLCLYFGTMNYKAVDIEKAAMFNQKGTNFAQLIFPMLVGLIGVIIYWPFAFFISPWAGILAIGLIGFTSFLLRDRWLNIITRQFSWSKYKMLDGFREK